MPPRPPRPPRPDSAPPPLAALCHETVLRHDRASRGWRFMAYQRGRGMSVHRQDTGYRDACLVLAEEAVRRIADLIRSDSRLQMSAVWAFRQAFRNESPGDESDEAADVRCAEAAARSVLGQAAVSTRSATAGTGGEWGGSRSLAGVAEYAAPSARRAPHHQLEDLKLVRGALLLGEGAVVAGEPILRLGFVHVTEFEPVWPSPSPRPDGGVYSSYARGHPAVDDLAELAKAGRPHGVALAAPQQVARAAGLHPDIIALAAQDLTGAELATGGGAHTPRGGRRSDFEACPEYLERAAEQDEAVAAIRDVTSPGPRVIAAALDARESGRCAFPIAHLRLGEARWAPAAGPTSPHGRLAVIPMTLAALNRSGQPKHDSHHTLIALAALIKMAPPAPESPSTAGGSTSTAPTASAHFGGQAGAAGASSSASSASSSASATAPAPAQAAAANGPAQRGTAPHPAPAARSDLVSVIAPPFSMASCASEDDARWVPGFKNKKLGRLPETFRPPKSVLEDKTAAAAAARAFAGMVSANLVPPAGQVALRRAARPGIIPRTKAVLLARRSHEGSDAGSGFGTPGSRGDGGDDDDWTTGGPRKPRSRRGRAAR